MPIQTSDPSVHKRSRSNGTLGQLAGGYNMVHNIRADVNAAKLRTRKDKDAEDQNFMASAFGAALDGWDQTDENDLAVRTGNALNSILRQRKDLGGKVLPIMQALEARNAEMGTKRGKLQEQGIINRAKEYELRKSQVLLKAETMAGATEDDYLNRLSYLNDLGIGTENFPKDFTTYKQNIPAFIDSLKAEERVWDNSIKGEEEKQAKTATLQGRANLAKTRVDTRNAKTKGVDESLGYSDNVAAYDLARKIGGVRGARIVYPMIVKGIKSGRTLDEIADEVRYSQQSQEFMGPAREGMQQIFAGKTGRATEMAFDSFDDILQSGDRDATGDYLKRSARNVAGADVKRQVAGQERTVEFLNEIENEMAEYVAGGGNTNVFMGNAERVAGAIGMVRDPKLRGIAQRIQTAIQKYRRSMSGVAFSVPESREYKILFPGIDKTAAFNTEAINALRETFTGDIEFFYRNAMGDKAFNAFLAEEEPPPPSTGGSFTSPSGNTYNLD